MTWQVLRAEFVVAARPLRGRALRHPARACSGPLGPLVDLVGRMVHNAVTKTGDVHDIVVRDGLRSDRAGPLPGTSWRGGWASREQSA